MNTGRMFDRIGGGRAIPGNRVKLLHDGPETFAAMAALIAAARVWIHLDNYIIRDDKTGWDINRALCAKAREGVAVRVMADWVGSLGTGRRFWRTLREAGVEVRLFGPLSLRQPLAVFSRNHRKLLVVDGVAAVTGGICIGDEWAGDDAAARLPWRDVGLVVDGPAAAALDLAFARVWTTAGPALPAGELEANPSAAGSAVVRVIGGEPGRTRLGRMALLLLAGAENRIWIMDAYMVAPRSLAEAMAEAARGGIDVRLLLPGSSDLPLLRNLTRFGYRFLLRSGIRIFEWQGSMLHGKAAVVDGRWVRVGSTNLNWSSLMGNWELDVVVEDVGLATELEASFRRDLERSAEVTLRSVPLTPGLHKVVRTSLQIGEPILSHQEHHRGYRERRQRTMVTLRSLVAGAQWGIYGTLAVFSLLTALLAFLTPKLVGIVLGLLSGAAAVIALWQAARRNPG